MRDDEEVVRPAGLLSVLPRFEEHIPPDFYRLAGKIRVVCVTLLLVVNWSGAAGIEQLGYDRDVFFPLHLANTPVLVISIAIGWLLWRRVRDERTMRRLTYAGIVVDTYSTLLMIWAHGSVQSHMIVFGMLLVLVYRAFFDFRTGAVAFALIVGGHWAIVLLEFAGAIPSAPLMVSHVDTAGQLRVGGMIVVTVMTVLTFLVANFTVARLHHKERAIRILRASLAAAEPGRVGRHTGRTLRGTYELGTLIGTGGMGEVYRARHLRTKRPLAVKMLHPHLLEDPLLIKRFRREAEITGRLGNAHIVEIVDIDDEDDQPYLVLELLEGESLRERMARDGALAPAFVAELIAQTARGLEVAHAAGVVHRDLKPDNLYLCPRDGGALVKILDFGVSKIQGAATAITREVALVGTPYYMSPEQAVGVVGEIGPQADIFALGAIAYDALTGQRPFQGASVPALLRRICDEAPPPPSELRPELPPDVDAVLAIAMAKRASERYATVGELAADLRAAVAGALPASVRDRAAAVYRGRPMPRTIPGGQDVNPTGDTLTATDETWPA